MRYRRLDSNGDYSFGNNAQNYISGSEAVAMAIKSKLLLFYNEWWEDLSIGIPMFQSIIGQVNKNSALIAIQNLFRTRILEIPQVLSVDDIAIDYSKRSAVVNIKCTVENNETVEVEVSI